MLDLLDAYNVVFYFGSFILATFVLWLAWKSTYVPGQENIAIFVVESRVGRQAILQRAVAGLSRSRVRPSIQLAETLEEGAFMRYRDSFDGESDFEVLLDVIGELSAHNTGRSIPTNVINDTSNLNVTSSVSSNYDRTAGTPGGNSLNMSSTSSIESNNTESDVEAEILGSVNDSDTNSTEAQSSNNSELQNVALTVSDSNNCFNMANADSSVSVRTKDPINLNHISLEESFSNMCSSSSHSLNLDENQPKSINSVSCSLALSRDTMPLNHNISNFGVGGASDILGSSEPNADAIGLRSGVPCVQSSSMINQSLSAAALSFKHNCDSSSGCSTDTIKVCAITSLKSSHTMEAAAISQDEACTSEAHSSTAEIQLSSKISTYPQGSIRIRLKFIDDKQKTVIGQLTQDVLCFKRSHFSAELEENRVVRLIFNGRLLKQDTSTLEQCGLFDNCVVHCHVSQPKPLPEPPAQSTSDTGSAPTPLGRHWTHMFWNATTTPAAEEGNGDDSGELDVSNYMSALLWLVVIGLWIARLKASHMFSPFSTFMLVFLTMLLVVPHYIFSVDVQLNLDLDHTTMSSLGIDRVVVVQRRSGRREGSGEGENDEAGGSGGDGDQTLSRVDGTVGEREGTEDGDDGRNDGSAVSLSSSESGGSSGVNNNTVICTQSGLHEEPVENLNGTWRSEAIGGARRRH